MHLFNCTGYFLIGLALCLLHQRIMKPHALPRSSLGLCGVRATCATHCGCETKDGSDELALCTGSGSLFLNECRYGFRKKVTSCTSQRIDMVLLVHRSYFSTVSTRCTFKLSGNRGRRACPGAPRVPAVNVGGGIIAAGRNN